MEKKLTGAGGSARLLPHAVNNNTQQHYRTMKKTLLIAVAALAAGIVSSQAQVYSQNIVGYVNVASPAGFSIIGNQLDTGTNTLANLLPAPANGTTIYKYGSAGYVGFTYVNGWGADGTNTLNPGEAAFIFCPFATTNTFVGTVLTGTNTVALRAGFTLVASPTPLAGFADTNLSLPLQNGETVYTYSGGYSGSTYVNGWTPPQINTSQGFFVFSPTATNWVQVVTPQ
jgi:hypothetical protein